MIWWYFFLALGLARLFFRAGIAALFLQRFNHGPHPST